MPNEAHDFCFCTLALGHKYRKMAQNLAIDLVRYSPNTTLIVYTDAPNHFSDFQNVLAFQHFQQGVGGCYHDKRFAIEKGLSMFRAVICIDADTRITNPIPTSIPWQPGITSGVVRNILTHPANKKHPIRLECIRNLAQKLNISLDETHWTEENLLVFAKDNGKEFEFIKQWGKIAKYFELRHIHSSEGNAIGLAAAKVGWTFHQDGWQALNKVRKHTFTTSKPWLIQNSNRGKQPNRLSFFWSQLNYKLIYKYRFAIARLTAAFTDFDFYYR